MGNETEYTVSVELNVFWLTGIIYSIVCLIVQVLLYYLQPSIRKIDQKILTQMSVARLINVIFEYFILNKIFSDRGMVNCEYVIYTHTDAALVCWMFVFMKNLYDNVTNVFRDKINFTLVSVIIWTVTFPIGFLNTLFLALDYYNGTKYFKTFFKVYTIIKFAILAVNLIMFIIVFLVAINRSAKSVSALRKYIICFIIVNITSVQVLVTDSLAIAYDSVRTSCLTGIINSYEVLAITAMFLVLVQSARDVSHK